MITFEAMSKKRKTRKQKEIAHLRHSEEIQKLHTHIEAPTYSVIGLKAEKISAIKENLQIKETFEQKDIAYLKHDITAITAASGIVAAFDILLFVLLTTGVLRLHFLGY
jgi:hypothetical protein